MTTKTNADLLQPSQAAKLAGLPKAEFDKFLLAGLVPGVESHQGRTLIRRDALEGWIAGRDGRGRRPGRARRRPGASSSGMAVQIGQRPRWHAGLPNTRIAEYLGVDAAGDRVGVTQQQASLDTSNDDATIIGTITEDLLSDALVGLPDECQPVAETIREERIFSTWSQDERTLLAKLRALPGERGGNGPQ